MTIGAARVVVAEAGAGCPVIAALMIPALADPEELLAFFFFFFS